MIEGEAEVHHAAHRDEILSILLDHDGTLHNSGGGKISPCG